MSFRIYRSPIATIDIISTISGGGGGSPVFTAGTLIEDFQAVGVGTHNITAGAYRVQVWNTGVTDITVNGDTVPPGENAKYEVGYNKTNSVQDFCPAVTVIVPSGGNASYKTEHPSP